MSKTERYFVGPTLLGEIRQTISRVSGMADRAAGASIPVAHQEIPRRGGGGGGEIRVGWFYGSWPVNTGKRVYLGAPPDFGTGAESVFASNIFCSAATMDCGTFRRCAVFKDGDNWYLLASSCIESTQVEA